MMVKRFPDVQLIADSNCNLPLHVAVDKQVLDTLKNPTFDLLMAKGDDDNEYVSNLSIALIYLSHGIIECINKFAVQQYITHVWVFSTLPTNAPSVLLESWE